MPTPATSVSPSISATEPLPSSTPSSCGLDVGAADQPAGADDERLVQDDETADERRTSTSGCRGSPNRAARWPRRCGRRDGGGHRDRVAAAHEDTLDQGLAAVGEAGHGAVYRLGADEHRSAVRASGGEPTLAGRGARAPSA